MSKAHFLEKLLDGAVTWEPLGKLGELIRGNGLPKTDFTEQGVPAIHYGQIYTYYGLSTTSTLSFVSPKTAEKLRKVNSGDVIITNTSENFKDVGKALVYLGSEQAVTGGHATIFKPSDKILGKYFAYFSQTSTFEKSKRKYAKGTKVIDVSASDMAKIDIPIPCPDDPKKSLKIQGEIVRILDAFTRLTAELTAELTARQKQYNYYRDKLLTFSDDADVEWRPLGDVASKIFSGGTPKTGISEYWENGTIPWMSSGEVNLETVYKTEKFITELGLKNSSSKYVPQNSVVIALAGQGKTRGKVARTRIELATNQSLAAITFNEKTINPDYIFHFLKTCYEDLRQISSGNSGRGGLNLQMISNYKVPIPYAHDPQKSLAEQARIVAILDKFDALTNSLTEGLPREIELRQKQYEYYRNLLLNFPDKRKGLHSGTN